MADGVRGAAEAMFPDNELGAPSWREVDLVERTLAYMDVVPPAQGRLLRILYGFLELSPRVLLRGVRRFSRLPVARRTVLIEGWRDSRLYPLRLLGDALKAQMTMMYLSHRAPLDYMGQRKLCKNPDDPFQVTIDETLLARDGGDAGAAGGPP